MKKRGFTLVELMIVIAVLAARLVRDAWLSMQADCPANNAMWLQRNPEGAVLASIIMPKMGGARNRSMIAACKGNLHQLATAVEMYATDNGGNYIPTSYSLPANFCFTDSCYLVSAGYMKFGPRCPYVSPLKNNQPFYWYSSSSNCIIYCATDSLGVVHPGLSGLNYPKYIFGKGVVER